jgi:NAD(P)-dependent dehydrogenase (short-subunit alcohol dehydrogenase family)
MEGQSRPTAVVSNATDFAGPPAVEALVAASFRVLVHDRTFTDPAIWARFSLAHPRAEYIEAADPASLIAAAWDAAGQIDVIVSNDHYPVIHGPSFEASLDDLRQTLEILVVEPFALLKAAIPHLKAQGGGNVVMITSCRTRLPMPGGAIPDAARAAANALVRSLAIELAPFEIAVNAIAPNFLYSEAYYPRAIFIDDPSGRAYVEAAVPARRLGRPDEIGELIRFLATTKARFLTGAIIDFAGGWPASQTRPG